MPPKRAGHVGERRGAMKKKGVNWMLVAQVAMTILVAIIIIRSTEWSKVWVLLSRLDLTWGLFSALTVLVTMALTSYRWGYIARGLGSTLGHVTAFRYIWLGMFMNQAMPSTIGSDGARVWLMTRDGDRPGRALNGVLLDRVLSLLGVLVLIILSQPWVLELTGTNTTGYAFMAWVGALLMGLVVLVIIGGPDIQPSRFRLLAGALQLIRDIRIYLLSPRLSIWPVLLTCINFIVLSVMTYLLSRGLNISLDLSHAVALCPSVYLMAILPISFAGWGVREGAMIVALGFVGVSPEEATALSVASGLLFLFCALPGGFFLLTLGGMKKWQQQVEEDQQQIKHVE